MLDKLCFCLDGDSISCSYHEYEDNFFKINPISLDRYSLYGLLDECLVKYRKEYIEKKTSNEKEYITIYDVDYEEMQQLKRLVNKNKEIIRGLDSVDEVYQEEKEKPKRKINRNKIKRTFVSISSAAIIATMGTLSYGKISKYIENFDFTPPEQVQVHNMPWLNFKEHPNLIAIEDINKNKLIPDDTDSVINEEELLIEDTTIISEIPISEDNSILIEDIPITNEIPQEEITNVDVVLNLYADDLTNGDKFYITKAYYYDLIKSTASEYGIDGNLMLAIATHERGLHNDKVDGGGGLGLFQIQMEGGWNWQNKEVKAYNFKNQEYDSLILTTEMVSDIYNNVRVGCMMMQNLLIKYNYNIALAVMAYNYGDTYMDKVLTSASINLGMDKSLFYDMNNLDWLEYRTVISGGDPEYLENVFKYIENDTLLEFTTPNNSNLVIQYHNNNYNKTK